MNIEQKAWRRIEGFLESDSFQGFTSKDLFIMKFIKKGWGQDIASLSYMAEAISSRAEIGNLNREEAKLLMREVISRAMHVSVSPYRERINETRNLGHHGYYLEHLNLIFGLAMALGVSDYLDIYLRVSEHLHKLSLEQKNAHAPLMPNVKMRWSADQAAILKSLWLCDKNNATNFHKEPTNRWIDFMKNTMTHMETGLFETEAMRVKRYSRQPRGCSLSYMIHYTSSFSPDLANEQWKRYKKFMFKRKFGLSGFCEYLPSYQGKWTPDTGPIIGGIGVAATGLALNTASSVNDRKTYDFLKKSIDQILGLCHLTKYVPGLNIFSSIGTDVLASSIYSSSAAKFQKNAQEDISYGPHS
jgi:hypothetical protein